MVKHIARLQSEQFAISNGKYSNVKYDFYVYRISNWMIVYMFHLKNDWLQILYQLPNSLYWFLGQ